MTSCFSGQMLSGDELRETLISAAKPIEQSELISLSDSLGRVLAEDIVSPLDVPSYDNSAMDGYAVRLADIADDGAELPIAQRIAAGHPGEPLAVGTAARIFTGARTPEGADAVYMQEECEIVGDAVRVTRKLNQNENIRPRANDIAKGALVLAKGSRLNAQSMGMLASLGVATLSVFRKVKVALLNTGDEIIEPGQPLADGQIYNSNRYTLRGVLETVGCEIVDLGQIEDTLEATRAAMLQAANEADLIITSGGVSVGEEDHIKAAVEAEGELTLWKVRIKPGKPVAFGNIKGTPFIGLPGNPVSVFVTFCLFAFPHLRVMQGCHSAFPESHFACLKNGLKKPVDRREYIRVKLHHNAAGLPVAEPFPRQGSDVLTSTVWADGVLEIPEDQELPANSVLRYWSFERLLG
jgi:molybdopterin molybdotransferase